MNPIVITGGSLDRAIAFHERALPVLGITDLDGQPRSRLQELAARELMP
jgi:hypothetical protein